MGWARRTGAPAAFAVNAASFWISALLLTRLGRLPPLQDDTTTAAAAGASSPLQPGLLADTVAGLRYAAQAPLVRALAVGDLPVRERSRRWTTSRWCSWSSGSLHGDGIEYGMLTAAFGAGMVAASVALARWARRLAGSVLADRRGDLRGRRGGRHGPGTDRQCWPGAAQAVAGAGNSADLVGTDTLLQQRVPAVLLGSCLQPGLRSRATGLGQLSMAWQGRW